MTIRSTSIRLERLSCASLIESGSFGGPAGMEPNRCGACAFLPPCGKGARSGFKIKGFNGKRYGGALSFSTKKASRSTLGDMLWLGIINGIFGNLMIHKGSVSKLGLFAKV
ncbi:hypothetical protein M2323_003315 [Rhodoblastus acidophilus]|uniref:hypothetical protein n=1 Tax=Rhodoblastus acidophilus TaxID=1074 RepID=UPI0022250803|nr:hypothetical protein [Rhodoblastus acidophilus]MCW2285378.1 hypothetical protein [Rhodoblastus acidophilus]MCW2334374.1 hypothetical protein [Rhodoblastus acidophilus]